MKALLILVAATFTLSPSLRAQDKLPIGTVDVEQVLQGYKKAVDQRNAMGEEIKTQLRAISEMSRAIEAQKLNMDMYPKGSSEWLDLLKKIKMQEAQVEFDKQALQLRYELKSAELLVKLYEEVCGAIKAVAEEKKLKIVFTHVGAKIKATSDSDVTNNIMVRQLVYFDPSSDITADVVNRLNK